MTRMSAWRGWSVLLTAAVCLAGPAPTWAAEPAELEQLLPANTVFVWSCSGVDSYAEAYKETAEYEAIYGTGLGPALDSLWKSLPLQAGLGLAQSEGDVGQVIEAFQDADVTWDPLGWISHLYHHGLALAVAMPSDESFIPSGTLVIYDAGESVEDLTKLFQKAAGEAAEVVEQKIGERTLHTVTVPDQPQIEILWWAEGDDLVITFGESAFEQLSARLDDDDQSLAAQDLWTKTWAEAPEDFAEANRIWFNVQPLLERFGEEPLPIPDVPFTLNVNWILKTAGLESFQAVGHRSGYAGRSAVGLTVVLTTNPRTGLFNLYGDRSLTLKDLPPLPVQLSALQASTMDATQVTEYGKNIWEQVQSLVTQVDGDAWSQVEEYLPEIAEEDWNSLVESLGDVMCIYGDNAQAVLPFGQQTIAISVKDADQFKESLDKILKSVKDSKAGPFVTVTRKTKHGVELVTLRAKSSMTSPTLAVSDGWLVWGDRPQVVEAFVLRQKGKLPKFSLKQLEPSARKNIPDEFDAIAIDDPRATTRFLVSLAPWLVDIGVFGSEMAMQFGVPWQVTVTSADIPPAELVVQSLYQGVTIVEIEDDAIRMTRKASTLIPETAAWTVGGIAVLAVFGMFGFAS